MKLNVVRVGNDGEGIAFSNNKPVFIYYAYKGEKVIADVSKNKRGSLMGDLKKVIKRSDKRVKAPCPYYGDCGGCNLMHINYIESLKHKRKETRYTNISNTHGSEDTFNYRNKINVPVRVINGKNDRTISKFMDHLDYAVKFMGTSNVCFGFDFMDYFEEYQGKNLNEIPDVTKAYKNIDAMSKRGYSKTDIENIAYNNFYNRFKKHIISK